MTSDSKCLPKLATMMSFVHSHATRPGPVSVRDCQRLGVMASVSKRFIREIGLVFYADEQEKNNIYLNNGYVF